MTPQEREIYQRGRAARTRGAGKFANPHRRMYHRHWWYAGWHDRDMEICRVLKPGATNASADNNNGGHGDYC